MPNKPRPENRHRMVRVEDELWEAARVAAEKEGTTRAEVMRQALRELVERRREIRGVPPAWLRVGTEGSDKAPSQ